MTHKYEDQKSRLFAYSKIEKDSMTVLFVVAKNMNQARDLLVSDGHDPKSIECEYWWTLEKEQSPSICLSICSEFNKE